ncbi:MAG: class I tRNA ligase family protein [Bacilli bacterium]|jgi:leucyl-tRNA synthetase
MYNYKDIEKKWQDYWLRNKSFQAVTNDQREKYYILIEFPYPSGTGLHIGHPRSYTALDVLARKRRMEGYNVLFPIGFDAFGLPAENYAILNKIHPKEAVKENIKVFKKQLQLLGISFDWDRELATTDPEYVKWTQWQFLKFYEHGLAYKDKKLINWCLSCKTGLANEEVEGGRCERCGGEIVRKEKEQWMLKMKSYADKLILGLEETNFVDRVKTAQINWIGKSEGAHIDFPIKGTKEKLKVYTTRPDTIYGVTFMVLAPEHPYLEKFKAKIKNQEEIKKYQERATRKSEFERLELNKEKTGVKIEGLTVVNPVTKKEIPLWISDYVMMGYGTGAIMAVPAHDDRDYDFAFKYNIPIIQVIAERTGQVRENEKSKNSIIAVLYDAKNNQYLTLNWGDKGGRLFIGGSVKDNETNLECALREIKEETGYSDVKLIRESFLIDHHYYAYNKKTAYNVKMTGFLFELNSSKQEELNLDSDEINNFKIEWVKEEIIKKEVVDEGHGLLFKNLLNKRPHINEGTMINSGILNGIKEEKEAIRVMIEYLVKNNLGEKATNYRLQDWVFSRQRFWGEPIPMIYCSNCGYVPVPEKDLPVLLPDIPMYEPTDDGESPLANIPEWYKVPCPKCGKEARRETDTMPNWAGSSWYWLRYMDPNNKKEFVSQEALNYWGKVDWYNGGMEHATRHLLYARFWHRFLYDIGLVPTKEPFQKRTAHGMVLGEDGEKMSKSRGNIINPNDIILEYGTDVLRTYELFMGDYESDTAWSNNGLKGCKRFLDRLWKIKDKVQEGDLYSSDLESIIHQTIKKVSHDIEEMKYNTAVSAIMILLNEYEKKDFITKADLRILLLLLNPIAPHITEEINELKELGEPFCESSWISYDEEKTIPDQYQMVVQINGKVRAKIDVLVNTKEDEMKELAFQEENVLRYTKGKEIKKVIVIPNKLINIVL